MKQLESKVAVAKAHTPKSHFMLLSLATLLLILCCTTALADDSTGSGDSAYKWQDSQGTVTYGDQPADPSSQKYDINAPQPATPTNSAPIPVTAPTQPAKPSEPVPKDDKGASKSAIEEQQQQIEENCKKAQENTELLQNNSRRIYVQGADGQPHYLTEEERQTQMDLAQKQVDAYCETPEKK